MSVELEKVKTDINLAFDSLKKRIVICAGIGCVANGALTIYDEFVKILKEKKLNITVELKKEDTDKDVSIAKSGCQGFCQMGPLVRVLPDEILYTKVKAQDVIEIIEKSILKNEVVDRLLYVNPKTKETCKGIEEIPFYKKQKRLLLKNCGQIDAESIDEYIGTGGYFMAKKACCDMNDEEICKYIIDSGLRGRGGGGFPTGMKWNFTRIEKSDKKYVICNGDEGDPGAFMDRSVMEGNPHAVIEGMIIASQAIGADEGYIYVRCEYPLAVQRLKLAIEAAEKIGVLGKNIFNSNKSFTLHVIEGAGAFVCGEETALIASIEGKRGMPSPKPPFPAQKGLFGKPTVINNVETLATISIIMKMGLEEFKKIGTENSPGTKTFAITGHVANTGLIEVPFGTTMREIVDDIAGGVLDENQDISLDAFKAVQIGGPSGACLTKKEWDLPLDFDSLKKVDAMVGSGGLVVMNDKSCMVSVAQFFMEFTQNESCGKCTPCREGTKRMYELLQNITEGKGKEEDIDKLKELAVLIKDTSLCGLGQTAPNPVLSTMKNFMNEYEEHIKEKRCKVGVCHALIQYIINDKCIGCTACSRVCPVEAITGKVKEKHLIDQEKCVKCGKCYNVCKFSAIDKG